MLGLSDLGQTLVRPQGTSSTNIASSSLARCAVRCSNCSSFCCFSEAEKSIHTGCADEVKLSSSATEAARSPADCQLLSKRTVNDLENDIEAIQHELIELAANDCVPDLRQAAAYLENEGSGIPAAAAPAQLASLKLQMTELGAGDRDIEAIQHELIELAANDCVPDLRKPALAPVIQEVPAPVTEERLEGMEAVKAQLASRKQELIELGANEGAAKSRADASSYLDDEGSISAQQPQQAEAVTVTQEVPAPVGEQKLEGMEAIRAQLARRKLQEELSELGHAMDEDTIESIRLELEGMTEGTLEEIKAGLVRTQLETAVGDQTIEGIKAGLAQAQVVLASTSPLPASAHSTPVKNTPPGSSNSNPDHNYNSIYSNSPHYL